jgi:3-phosphoshikimate 1-carboxyvinyltransferase
MDEAPSTAELVVRGGRRLVGRVPVVGDKSVSHRALLLGALADGDTHIVRLSPGADVRRTLGALWRLGIAIDVTGPDGATVRGRGVQALAGVGPVLLDCGDSGTTLRLLAGLLAGQPGCAFTLDGASGLRRRPMERVVAPLRALGADIEATDGHPPLVGRGSPLVGTEMTLPVASAQVGSALLLAGLNASGPTTVRYPAPVRDHTERLLAAMGAPLRWNSTESRLDGPVKHLSPPGGGRLVVPGDPSAAAFLVAAGAIVPGSMIELPGVGVNPGRTGLLDALLSMGAALTMDDLAALGPEPVATLSIRPGPLRGARVSGALVPRAIDELPLLAVVASQAAGRTTVRDAAELRVKESDRIAAICDGLARLGARIEPTADGFIVDGPSPLRGTRVAGHDDHRIVMALAVAALAAEGETVITDAQRVVDSFPGFVEALAALGADVTLRPAPAGVAA